MDHLLEENGLDIEAKEMLWEAISWTIEFGVSGLTLQRIMRDTSTCSKHLSALKDPPGTPKTKTREVGGGYIRQIL